MNTLFKALCQRPFVIMGIVNVTPDSFSDGGDYFDLDTALRRIEVCIQEGADIIDLGAESTRPGAKPVSEAEELSRLEPLVSVYSRYFDAPFSLDTTKSRVAELGCSYGMTLLNDISALRFDPEMEAVVRCYTPAVALMHMQKAPGTMQVQPTYADVVSDVFSFLEKQCELVASLGVADIVVDPGIGFGKTVDHNLALLRHTDAFLSLGYPVMLGTSRKSFIGAITGDGVADRLSGSLASIVLGLQSGATWFRVHDVGDSKRALTVANAIMASE